MHTIQIQLQPNEFHSAIFGLNERWIDCYSYCTPPTLRRQINTYMIADLTHLIIIFKQTADDFDDFPCFSVDLNWKLAAMWYHSNYHNRQRNSNYKYHNHSKWHNCRSDFVQIYVFRKHLIHTSHYRYFIFDTGQTLSTITIIIRASDKNNFGQKTPHELKIQTFLSGSTHHKSSKMRVLTIFSPLCIVMLK